MRKVIVCNLMSLDGYVAGPGGNLMVLPLDESFSAYNLERLRTAETLLLGRNTFEGFVGYWPGVAEDEDQPEDEREISRINNEIEKVVVSDSLTEEATGPWRDTHPDRAASRRPRADRRAEARRRRRHPDVRQRDAVERPARQRSGRRAAPHGRQRRSR